MPTIKNVQPIIMLLTEEKVRANSLTLLEFMTQSKRFDALKEKVLEVMDDLILFYKNSMKIPKLMEIMDSIQRKDYFKDFDSLVLSDFKKLLMIECVNFIGIDDKIIRQYIKYAYLSYLKLCRVILAKSNSVDDINYQIDNLNHKIDKGREAFKEHNCDSCSYKDICPTGNSDESNDCEPDKNLYI